MQQTFYQSHHKYRNLQNKLQLCLNAVIVDDLLYGRADLSDKLNKILFEIVHCYIADTKRFEMK